MERVTPPASDSRAELREPEVVMAKLREIAHDTSPLKPSLLMLEAADTIAVLLRSTPTDSGEPEPVADGGLVAELESRAKTIVEAAGPYGLGYVPMRRVSVDMRDAKLLQRAADALLRQQPAAPDSGTDVEALRDALRAIAEWCESYAAVQLESPLPGTTTKIKLRWAQTVIEAMGKRARAALSTTAPHQEAKQ